MGETKSGPLVAVVVGYWVVQSMAEQGLVEVIGREKCTELFVYGGGPVVWVARLTGHGWDALVYEGKLRPDRRSGLRRDPQPPAQ